MAFRLSGRAGLALSPEGLSITLTVENMDTRAMPAGLGLHPFFPRRAGVQLRFAARNVHLSGPDSLPAECIPVPAKWDYTSMRDLGEPGLDNCFERLGRNAEILFEQEGSSSDLMPIRSSATSSSMCRPGVIFSPSNRSLI